MSKSNIAIIPARGGSKRIPFKNIKTLKGKPLIAWTIEAALKSEIFDKVLVSTDSEEIAKVSREYGAEVPFLREEAADDFTVVSLATLAALKQAENHWDKTWDYVYQLMPNCPIRNEKDILKMEEHLRDHPSKSALSCVEFGWMNPWWAFELGDDKRPKELFPGKATSTRSQDLPNLFSVTGSIWAMKTKILKEEKNFYTDDRTYCQISWKSALDIDSHEDFEMAEVLMELNK